MLRQDADLLRVEVDVSEHASCLSAYHVLHNSASEPGEALVVALMSIWQ